MVNVETFESVKLLEVVNAVAHIAREHLAAQDTKVETGQDGWFALEVEFEFITEVSIHGASSISKRQVWVRTELHPHANGLVELHAWGSKPIRIDPDPGVIASLLFARAWCKDRRTLEGLGG